MSPTSLSGRFKHNVSVRQRSKLILRLFEERCPGE